MRFDEPVLMRPRFSPPHTSHSSSQSTLLDAISGRKTVGKLTYDKFVIGSKRPSSGFLKRRTGERTYP